LSKLAPELIRGAAFLTKRSCRVTDRDAKLLGLEPERERFGELSSFASPVRPTTLGIVGPLARPSHSALALRRRHDGPSCGRWPALTLQPRSSWWFIRSACAAGVARNVARSVARSVAARHFLRLTVARTVA